MIGIDDILSAQPGPYEWTRLDCLSIAHAIVERRCGKGCAPAITEWHALSESRAWARGIERYGSCVAGFVAVLGAVKGLEIMDGARPLLPGDMVWMSGEIEAAGEHWDFERVGGILGFVSDAYEIFVVTGAGLTPVRGVAVIEKVFRCHLLS